MIQAGKRSDKMPQIVYSITMPVKYQDIMPYKRLIIIFFLCLTEVELRGDALLAPVEGQREQGLLYYPRKFTTASLQPWSPGPGPVECNCATTEMRAPASSTIHTYQSPASQAVQYGDVIASVGFTLTDSTAGTPQGGTAWRGPGGS